VVRGEPSPTRPCRTAGLRDRYNSGDIDDSSPLPSPAGPCGRGDRDDPLSDGPFKSPNVCDLVASSGLLGAMSPRALLNYAMKACSDSQLAVIRRRSANARCAFWTPIFTCCKYRCFWASGPHPGAYCGAVLFRKHSDATTGSDPQDLTKPPPAPPPQTKRRRRRPKPESIRFRSIPMPPERAALLDATPPSEYPSFFLSPTFSVPLC